MLLILYKFSFAEKADMDMQLKQIYEKASDIITSRKGRIAKAAELSELYSRLGRLSTSFDNKLYDELGMSCEDIINKLGGRKNI